MTDKQREEHGDIRAEKEERRETTAEERRAEETSSASRPAHREAEATPARRVAHGASEEDTVTRVVQSTISWKGIFAGAFVGILVYLGLAALGVAFGAIGMDEAVEAGSGGMALTIGMGIWLIAITLVSLFAGGYVASRASGIVPTRIGGIEGLVVAGLFFVVMVTGFGAGVSALGRTASSVVGSVAGGVANVAQSQEVQSVVEEATAGLNLRSEPSQVVQGVATRLIDGREAAAATYLARQAGISTGEAQQRVQQVKSNVVAAAKTAAQAAAAAIQITGWVFFGMILLGGAAALFGGAAGARRNIRRPISDRDRKVAQESQPAWTELRPREEALPRAT
jgi:hypothetical protein